MTNCNVKLCVLAGGMFVGAISASPTSNEFIPCKKLAVAKLEYCLNGDNNDCWAKSKGSYESCHKAIIEKHGVKNKQIEKAKNKSDTHKG
ncbi:MAG: hypothetical protein ABJH28_13990 [Paraglaciecola sp.]|uniref:hypothetical protein n=1 Tax=Paraglaciecola sp. TaxID=1920173 RepID=UPI003267A38B